MGPQRPLILLTNDDGVMAHGLTALRQAFAPLGDVWVVAPETEQSGVGHGITLHRFLRIRALAEQVLAVDGTPTDCVYIALNKVLPRQPALVVSGVNHGGNLGDDVLYSGTVGAALEGAHHGLPSMAVSRVASHGVGGPADFEVAAGFASTLAQQVLAQGLPSGLVLNVNVPKRATVDTRFQVCGLGRHTWRSVVEERQDPRGRPYYWIGGPWGGHEDVPGTDCHAIHRGIISVTPVRARLTDQESLATWGQVKAVGNFRAWEG